MQPLAVQIIIVLLLTTGCGASTPSLGPGAGSSSSKLQQGIPPGEPSITGVITALEPDGRVRVEEKGARSGGRAALLKVTSETRLIHRDGRGAAPADLVVNTRVSVWYEGPAAESFPIQATAGTIVIEPAEL